MKYSPVCINQTQITSNYNDDPKIKSVRNEFGGKVLKWSE